MNIYIILTICFYSVIALCASDNQAVETSRTPYFIVTVLMVIAITLAIILIGYVKREKKLKAKNRRLKEELDKAGDLSSSIVDMRDQMKVFYDQTIFGFMIVQDGVVQYVNKIALDILEYTLEEIKSWSVDDLYQLVYEDDRESVKDFYKLDSPGHRGVSHNYSFRIVSKNRTIKWIDQCSRVISHDGGEAIIILFVDMTELKQVEEQVNIFKRFAESSGQGLVNMDSLGNPIFVNNSFCDTILASNPKEVLVKNITAFYPPKLKRLILDEIIPTTLKVGQWVGELPLLTTTGKMVPTLQTFFKVSEEYGKPNHVAAVISDISDMRLAEEELMFTRNYIRNVLYSIQSLIVAINSDFSITQWNDAAVSFSGVNADDAISRNIFDILPFLNRYRAKFEEVIQSREKIELFKEMVTRGDSEVMYLNISCYPLNDDYMDGVVICVDDITEMEKKDEQIRQVQKMEAISKLAGRMAHDFNNLLGGMKGSISIIKHLISRQEIDVAKISECIDNADLAVNKATDMIGEVLEISQKSKINTIPVDLNSTVKHVGIICRKTFDESVKVRISCYDEPAMVSADPAKIENAILNVCRNAENAMTSMRGDSEVFGGELVIGIEIIYADKYFCSVHSEATEGYYWIVRITDNGVGLDTKTLSKIFDPFYSTNKSGKAAGLGLAIVYNIVQQHNGFIDVYSEIGVGSTFNIFIPELAGGAVEIPFDIDSEELYTDEGGSILVVDDDNVIRVTAKSILEECGYEVLLAANGKDAIKLFMERKGEVDVVILDMSMPIMSGRETFIEIKKISPEQKVLMASGFMQDERLKEVLDMGANGFIQKPYSMSGLSLKVKEIITNK